MRRLSRLSALLVALVALPASLFAQGGGTITGRVIGAESGQPIASANILVQGSALTAVTNGEGRFRIANVPAGTYTVSATTLGRETANRQVTVVAGQTATIDFTLSTRAIALEGLVATATGELQRARETPVNVGRVNVEDVPLAATADVSQVLQGRTAGVSVLQSGGTNGTGSRIRIRGNASVSLNNDPLWIVDGVRAETGSAGFAVGGQTLSRQMDINPEEIESIEVLKGPSASALYGTAAANGVIVVTTKKGRAGRTRVHAYTEYGNVEDVTTYPANATGYCSFQIPGAATRSEFGSYCDIGTYGDSGNVADFDIRLDSVVSFNPLEDPRSTPFRTGVRRKLGVSASGGSEAVTFFLSGAIDDEGGVYKFDQNEVERKNLRANVRGQLRSNADFTVSAGYVNADATLPQNDNNALGLVSGALLSSRVRFDSTSLGYGFNVTPRQIATREVRNLVDRFTGSLDARWQPSAWLSLTGQVGLDRVSGADIFFTPPGTLPFNATSLEGTRSVFRVGSANYTANFNATANANVASNLTSSTSAGVQYSEELSRSTQADGSVLLAGVGSLTGATARFAITEGNFQVRTIGGYVQQQFGLNDRLFVNAALRADDNSAFGNDFGLVTYPSLGASWVVAEEPWFPQFDVLSTLRLRAAYGTSGLRPGTLDALTYLDPVAVRTTTTTSAPGFTVGGTGNVNLRPEKSKEFELGFDLGLLDDRVGLEFTYFDKDSEDALVAVRTAPSLGVTTTRRENLGSVENKGIETLLRARLFERDRFRWDATVQYSTLKNRLVSLGEGISPITFGLGGASQRHTPGQPLGAFIARPYTFADSDGNGLITPNELTFTSDTSVIVGSPFPTREASFQTNLELFKVLRISGLVDYRGGHKQFNSTTEFRCGSFFNCPEIYDPTTPLEDQAAAIATGYFDSWYGYMEDADFVKLREVAFTLGLPQRLADRFGAQGLSLTLAGRNLKTWTDYKGLDPEITYAGTGSNFNTAEFLTQPPVRYWTLRLDVNL